MKKMQFLYCLENASREMPILHLSNRLSTLHAGVHHMPFTALRATAQHHQAVVSRHLAAKYSYDEDMKLFVQKL
jgi:hypothetical protein